MEKKILHLTLKKKWFDLIAQEKKTIEFRELKPYWEKRLVKGIKKWYGSKIFMGGSGYDIKQKLPKEQTKLTELF